MTVIRVIISRTGTTRREAVRAQVPPTPTQGGTRALLRDSFAAYTLPHNPNNSAASHRAQATARHTNPLRRCAAAAADGGQLTEGAAHARRCAQRRNLTQRNLTKPCYTPSRARTNIANTRRRISRWASTHRRVPCVVCALHSLSHNPIHFPPITITHARNACTRRRRGRAHSVPTVRVAGRAAAGAGGRRGSPQ